MKGGGEKADHAGTLGAGKRHGSEFSGFSFCLICPGMGAGEDDDLGIPMRTDTWTQAEKSEQLGHPALTLLEARKGLNPRLWVHFNALAVKSHCLFGSEL